LIHLMRLPPHMWPCAAKRDLATRHLIRDRGRTRLPLIHILTMTSGTARVWLPLPPSGTSTGHLKIKTVDSRYTRRNGLSIEVPVCSPEVVAAS
jgi:hypothetical protein